MIQKTNFLPHIAKPVYAKTLIFAPEKKLIFNLLIETIKRFHFG